jgi:hypothetical protein
LLLSSFFTSAGAFYERAATKLTVIRIQSHEYNHTNTVSRTRYYCYYYYYYDHDYSYYYYDHDHDCWVSAPCDAAGDMLCPKLLFPIASRAAASPGWARQSGAVGPRRLALQDRAPQTGEAAAAAARREVIGVGLVRLHPYVDECSPSIARSCSSSGGSQSQR